MPSSPQTSPTPPPGLGILFIAANPVESDRLALDHEYRAIEEAIAGTPLGGVLRLEAGWAMDFRRLNAKLLATRPTVIHFAGHGVGGGLLLEADGADPLDDGLVSPEALTELLAVLGDGVRLVVLNACFTEALAATLTRVVPCSVGMRSSVPDIAALRFAEHFYRVLAHGKSIGAAFRAGALAIEQMSLRGAPQLALAEGIEADTLRLDDLSASDVHEHAPLNMAPRPAPGWVPRPHALDEVLTLLTRNARDDSRSVSAAIVGAGGYGKTSLARGIASDPRSTEAFPDGTLWVTLGQTGRPVDGLATIYAALTGERPRFTGDDDARHAVASVIGDQALLLIVDDVWSAAQLTPFLDWGPHVARLITTRDHRVLPQAARVLELGRLGDEEATSILVDALPTPDPVQRAALRRLARRLGGWPLLLALTGPLLAASVRHGQTLEEAIADTAADVDLEGPAAISEDIGRMIEASLRSLPAELRAHYRELAFFPEGSSVPIELLGDLWALRPSATWRLCLELAQRSLIENLDRRSGLRLHDILRAHIRAGSRDDARTTAGRVLAIWGVDVGAGPPSSAVLRDLSDYALEHLAHFIVLAAGDPGRVLGGLVVDVEYIQIKIERLGTSTILHDLEVAAAHVTDRPRRDQLRAISASLRKIAHWSVLEQSALPRSLYNALRTRGWSADQIADRLRWPNQQLPNLRLLHPLQMIDGSEQLLVGHRRGIWACASSPDGGVLATGDRDGVVRLWDAATGQHMETLAQHRRDIVSIAIDQHGRLFTASRDGSVIARDLAACRDLWHHKAGRSGASSAVLLASGELLVSDLAGRIERIDPADGRVLQSFSGKRWPLTAIAPSNDGHHLITVVDGDLELWDLTNGHAVQTIPARSASFTACAFGRGGTILTGDESGEIQVWDLHGAARGRLPGHTAAVLSLMIAPDGRQALSAASDNTLRLWELPIGQEITVLRGHADWVRACTFYGDNRALSVSSDRTARLWDLHSLSPARPLQGHEGHGVSACTITPDGARALSGGTDGQLLAWDLASGDCTRILRGGSSLIVGVALAPDGTRAVAADIAGTLWTCDLTSGAEESTSHLDTAITGLVGSAGATIVFTTETSLKVWGETIDTIPLEGPCGAVCVLSPDGTLAAVGSGGTLQVWPLTTGSSPLHLTIRGATALSAVISPDSRWLLAGYDDYVLRLWDLDRCAVAAEFRGHYGYIHGCAFACGGRQAISAANDQTLRVWDLETGACLAVTCGEHAFTSVAAAGERIVAGDQGGNFWMLS